MPVDGPHGAVYRRMLPYENKLDFLGKVMCDWHEAHPSVVPVVLVPLRGSECVFPSAGDLLSRHWSTVAVLLQLLREQLDFTFEVVVCVELGSVKSHTLLHDRPTFDDILLDDELLARVSMAMFSDPTRLSRMQKDWEALCQLARRFRDAGVPIYSLCARCGPERLAEQLRADDGLVTPVVDLPVLRVLAAGSGAVVANAQYTVRRLRDRRLVALECFGDDEAFIQASNVTDFIRRTSRTVLDALVTKISATELAFAVRCSPSGRPVSGTQTGGLLARLDLEARPARLPVRIHMFEKNDGKSHFRESKLSALFTPGNLNEWPLWRDVVAPALTADNRCRRVIVASAVDRVARQASLMRALRAPIEQRRVALMVLEIPVELFVAVGEAWLHSSRERRLTHFFLDDIDVDGAVEDLYGHLLKQALADPIGSAATLPLPLVIGPRVFNLVEQFTQMVSEEFLGAFSWASMRRLLDIFASDLADVPVMIESGRVAAVGNSEKSWTCVVKTVSVLSQQHEATCGGSTEDAVAHVKDFCRAVGDGDTFCLRARTHVCFYNNLPPSIAGLQPDHVLRLHRCADCVRGLAEATNAARRAKARKRARAVAEEEMAKRKSSADRVDAAAASPVQGLPPSTAATAAAAAAATEADEPVARGRRAPGPTRNDVFLGLQEHNKNLNVQPHSPTDEDLRQLAPRFERFWSAVGRAVAQSEEPVVITLEDAPAPGAPNAWFWVLGTVVGQSKGDAIQISRYYYNKKGVFFIKAGIKSPECGYLQFCIANWYRLLHTPRLLGEE